MTDLQPEAKDLVFAARNGQWGEFYNQLESDKALAFLLLVLREHSKQVLAEADDNSMTEQDAYEAILELYARGYLALTEREDGSIVAEATTPEETAARGRTVMSNSPSIN